jgi:hypothetical protein
MQQTSGKGPKPYKQRKASTVFLRIPPGDYSAIARGAKTEFRGASGRVSGLHFVQPPTPVVGYTERLGKYKSTLLVLEKRWTEPLGAISDESLRNEGFESLAHFRRYWMDRERRRFRPTRDVVVYRVRPWNEDDQRVFSSRILDHLYGEWL